MSNCKKIIFSLFIGILFQHAAQLNAQIDISYIDKQIKESKTFEFDYYGNYDYLKNVADGHGISNFNNRLLFNRNIENIHSGNWQNVNFEIARYNNKGNKIQKFQLKRLSKRIEIKKEMFFELTYDWIIYYSLFFLTYIILYLDPEFLIRLNEPNIPSYLILTSISSLIWTCFIYLILLWPVSSDNSLLLFFP